MMRRVKSYQVQILSHTMSTNNQHSLGRNVLESLLLCQIHTHCPCWPITGSNQLLAALICKAGVTSSKSSLGQQKQNLAVTLRRVLSLNTQQVS